MSNESRFVITGMGVVNPAGCTLAEFWNTLLEGRPVLRPMQLFGQETEAQQVGKINDGNYTHFLAKRHLKRIDRFSAFAIAATRQALEQARIPCEEIETSRVGILVGNTTGGWSYVEPMMYKLYQGDFDIIDAYVATAWFPTAAQGEISILLGLGGYSKTFCAENISAGYALQSALYALSNSDVDAAVVIGVDAPLTPLVYNACVHSQLISPSQHYQPFTEGANGSLLGEGGAALVVETLESAKRRQTQIHAEICGFGFGVDLRESICNCLSQANVDSGAVDYVVLDARGTTSSDQTEYNALAECFAPSNIPLLSAPKTIYGNLLGGSLATDLLIGCQALVHQLVPPTAKAPVALQPSPVGRHVAGRAEQAQLRYVLVNGRDNYGQSCSVLLSGPASIQGASQ